MDLTNQTDPSQCFTAEIDYRPLYVALQRRYERERSARRQAEAIAEEGLRALHQRERHSALLEAVSRHANGSVSQAEALHSALVEICQHTGWACGFVYLPSTSHERTLSLSPGVHVPGEGLDAFLTATAAARFMPKVGLPGRVDARKEPLWLCDVTEDDNFLRKAEAIACGLRAGIAFPILVESEVAAVLEFFARESLEPDLVFLDVLAAIGHQLGRVVERERTKARLLHDANHDGLTSLPNRVMLLDRLDATVRDKRSATDPSFAVLFIDLDRFKLINDSLGHRAGDALLVAIASRFDEVLKPTGLQYVLARLGGDEFVVLAERIDGMTDAARLAETLLAALRNPIDIEGQSLYASASIGVTCGNFGYESAADVLRDADLAMYEAKKQGKARIGIFEPQLHLQAVTRLALETDLRRALREHQFVLHYQPIVALGSRHLLGFEALVRWRKPNGVLVPPGDFIEIAEETGLIVFIGEQVLQQACKQVVRWNVGRGMTDQVSVSVNVSATQIRQPDFLNSITRALADAGASPAMLRIELTESVAIENFKQTASTLLSLRELGVSVSIDDFGTGQSSLSYLHQLTFDVIKIDKSFVHAMGSNSDGGQIVRTILDLARNLDVKVVAEGAETFAQMIELERLGCGYVQGFYVSRPLDERAVVAWLAAQDPVSATAGSYPLGNVAACA